MCNCINFFIHINSMRKYTGAYDDEEAAARAYDLAALKYWGAGTQINFPVSHLYLLIIIGFLASI